MSIIPVKRRIYLAARWIRMEEMVWVADQLKKLGHVCTARWVFGAEAGMTSQENALMDVEDVQRSDLVISYTHPRDRPQPGGGRHFESGLAYANQIEQWIVGPVEHVFHRLPGIRQFDCTQEVLWELGAPKTGLLKGGV